MEKHLSPVKIACCAAAFLTMGATGLPSGAQSTSPGGVTGSGTLTLPKPPQSQTSGAVLVDTQTTTLGRSVDLLAFTLTNNDKNAIKYDFNTGKQFDIVIVDTSGNEVWTWSNGQSFAPLITHLRLKSGQSRTFKVQWKHVDDSGKPVPEGTYTATATLISIPRLVVSKGPAINVNTEDRDPTNVSVAQPSSGPNNTISTQDNEAIEKDIAPSVSAKTTITVSSSG